MPKPGNWEDFAAYKEASPFGKIKKNPSPSSTKPNTKSSLTYAPSCSCVSKHLCRSRPRAGGHSRSCSNPALLQLCATGVLQHKEGGCSASQQLRDSFRWWLMAEEQNTEQFIEQVVLEQFVARLLTGIVEWVQCYWPTSVDEAMQLMKDQLVAVPDPGVLGLSRFVSLLPSYPQKPEARTRFPPLLGRGEMGSLAPPLTPQPLVWIPLLDFTFDKMIVTNGQKIQPIVALSLPVFNY